MAMLNNQRVIFIIYYIANIWVMWKKKVHLPTQFDVLLVKIGLGRELVNPIYHHRNPSETPLFSSTNQWEFGTSMGMFHRQYPENGIP